MNVPFRSFPAPSNALRTLTTAILIGFALLYMRLMRVDL